MENTRQLARVSLMGAILFVIFTSFSNVLYLEMITLSIVLFALVFKRKEAIYATLVFTMLNLLVQGIAPWSIAYILIFTSYAFFTSMSKQFLLKHRMILVVYVGFLSFLTGQLVQIPFMLVSSKITIVYILLGLKTSLIQSTITTIATLLLFDPLYKTLLKIERQSV